MFSSFEDRAKERGRRIALTTIATAVAKAISMATGLITVPLTLNYLGVERYGMWMTISSVVALLAFTDMGIGNGLLNSIAEANGKDDRQLARGYVSSAFFILLGIALFLGVLFALAYPWVSWSRVFNVSTGPAVREAGPAIAAFMACFLVNIPMGIVQRIQLGYQEGYVNALWQGLGSLLGLGAVILSVNLKLGLPWLIFSLAGIPVVALIANGTALFLVERRWLIPSWSCVNRHAIRHILDMGIFFFVLQILGVFNYSSDNIILSQILGADAVAGYSVAARLFSIFPILLGMFLMPLWSAYGEAHARGDRFWIKQIFKKTLGWSLVINTLGSILLVLWGQQIIDWWVGPHVSLPFLLFLGMGLANLLNAFAGSMAMLFNGLNILRFQVGCMLFASGGLLAAKIILTRKMGLPGMVWGTLLAQILCCLIPSLVYLRWKVWPRLSV